MPFDQQMNSNLVDRNDIQAKRGIFRNKAHASTPTIRSKVSGNVVPTKLNHSKLQSKILNRRDQTAGTHLKIELPKLMWTDQRNIVQTPNIQLVQGNYLSNVSQVNGFALGQSDQSKVLRMERCDESTISVSKKSLSNGNASVKLEIDEAPCTVFREQTSNVDSCEITIIQEVQQNESVISNSYGGVSSSANAFLFDANHFNQSIPRKSNTFIKDDGGNDSSEMVMQAKPMGITNDAETSTTSTVNHLKREESSRVSFGSDRAGLLESELKSYSENLKKYDQEAKYVIDKFTESLNEKGNIIRKYEEELSSFNDRVSHLQTQLEESLERTKQMEPIAVNAAISNPWADLKSENEKLNEIIRNLETKLAKRDIHIYNLKEVLAIETNKIKELNKAQVEINHLQRDIIDKSREITVLRDELKYAAKMRLELVNEYDEKIVKLKKLLAIREYLLIKEKS